MLCIKKKNVSYFKMATENYNSILEISESTVLFSTAIRRNNGSIFVWRQETEVGKTEAIISTYNEHFIPVYCILYIVYC